MTPDHTGQLPLPLDTPPSNIRAIEGGRAIEARNVQSSFAVDTDDLSTSMPDAAGYVVLMWDDEGAVSCAYHFGRRNPFSPVSVPDLLRNRLAYNIANGGDE